MILLQVDFMCTLEWGGAGGWRKESSYQNKFPLTWKTQIFEH